MINLINLAEIAQADGRDEAKAYGARGATDIYAIVAQAKPVTRMQQMYNVAEPSDAAISVYTLNYVAGYVAQQA